MGATFLQGENVKALKDNIEMANGIKIMTGAADPTATAVSAAKGSTYESSLTGESYIKQDAGLSTNWAKLANSTSVERAVEIAKGTRLVSASIATITGGGLTVTSPAYKVHIVDHATNTLTVAEKTTPTVFTPPNYTTPIWYAYINAANTVHWESKEIGVPANRTLVPIFSAITNGAAIVALNNGTRGSYRDFNGFIQDFALAYPPKSMKGNVITLTGFPNAGGALLNKTEGLIFVPGANVVGNSSGSEGAVPSANFLPYTSIVNDMQGAGGVGFITFQSARLSGANYDVNGVLTSTGNNNWTIRAIYVGQGGLVVSPLGQTRYTSLVNARNALGSEPNNVNPNLLGLMLTGWALCRGNNQEFVFVANANSYGAGSPSVSLNLWTVRTLTSADSPFTVAGSKTIYVCDTAAGNIEVVLPTIDSSIASDENRFVKSASANSVKVSVNGGVQTIGGKTAQYIWEQNTAFSVVASATLEYLVTQDSRKVDTFETPVGVWAKTSSIEHWDLASSTLGTGATFTGNNHGATLTSGTTASTVYSKEVSTEELIADKNYFAFVANCSTDSVFDLIVEGWNGSAWAQVGGLVAPFAVGDALNGLVPFFKTGYTKWRAVLTNSGTTSGLTCTIARGEWTDAHWKEVQIPSDPISSKVYSSASLGSTNTKVMVFINGDINTDNDLYKIETTAALGTVLTVKKRCLIGSSLTASFGGAYNSGIVRNATVNIAPSSQNKGDIIASSTHTAANYENTCSHSAIEFQAGDKIYPMGESTPSDASNNISVWTITATPIGTSKGIVAAAEVDLSQYNGATYDPYALGLFTAYSSTPTSASTSVYLWKTSNGKIFMDFQFDFIVASASRVVWTCTLGGVQLVRFGTCEAANSSTIENCVGSVSPAGVFSNNHGTSTTNRYYFGGTVELASWPTWATQPTIKPATIIAPVAVIDSFVCGIGGQAGTTLAMATTDTKIVRVTGYATTNASKLTEYFNILDSAANGTRFVAKKNFKLNATIGADLTGTDAAPVGISINASALTAGYQTLPDANKLTIMTYASVTGSYGSADIKIGDVLRIHLGATAISNDYLYFKLIFDIENFDTSYYAIHESKVHENATYLSSNETEAGWCEFTGKKIWKRSFYFPSSISTSQDIATLQTGLAIVNPQATYLAAPAYFIVQGITDTGSQYAWITYTPSTGVLRVAIVGSFGIMAGNRFTLTYTKP